jgi:signal transduction histidine kinase
MVAAAIIGSIALMLLAARTLDHIESLDERALVQRTIARDLTRMTRELTSASVWDDAVKATSVPVDGAWADSNFGEYYAKYFNHDLTFVLRDDQVIYAAMAGVRVNPHRLGALARDSSGLVRPVADQARIVHARGGHSLDAVSTAEGLIRSDDELYLVVASDILAETPAMASQNLGSPAVIVSARRVGTAYVRGLRQDLGIDDLVFTDRPAADQIVVPLRDPAGRTIGAASWPPTEPGTTLLRHAAPWIGLVFLALVACASVLFFRVNEALHRMEASRLALVEAKEEAEAANAAKTQFLSNMSHEIRTPLNGVLGMNQIMEADELSIRQRDRLAVVTTSGLALLALLNDILDMARLEGRKLRLSSEPFDLAALVNEACVLFSGAAATKAITLTCEVSSACRGQWIGDAVRLRQVLSNLIANAVKFTDRGSVTVRAIAVGAIVRFEVQDTGMGIAHDDQSRLFKIFSQVDQSSTRSHDGSGLGLAISRDLVALMGGHIEVDSAVGAGSLFYFEVPLRRAERHALRLVSGD